MEEARMFNTTNVAEFTGFSLTYNPHQPGANQFAIESIALAAIGAMKEEALLDYSGPVLDFDYTDEVDPDNPVRITAQAVLGAAAARTKRSTVIWMLRTLSVQMMRRGILRPLPFSVWIWRAPVYTGELREREVLLGSRKSSDSHNDTALPARRALGDTHSLTVVTPTPNSTTIILQTPSAPQEPNSPLYQVNFHLVGIPLEAPEIFESLLNLLLQLAHSDAAAAIPRCGINNTNLQALVFMMEVGLPVESVHRFQQFHAVAIVQAIARYYVMRGEYRELTFDFHVNGVLVAWGCVVTTWMSRRWCQGLVGPLMMMDLGVR